jgi:hypothetical protein
VLGDLADDEQPDVAVSGVRTACERDGFIEAPLANEDDREVARRIATGIEDERAAKQPLGGRGRGFVIGIVLERDFDQHAGELAA